MSFSQGVSGLQAASSGLDTIGNNIANSQTVGFKSGRAQFADLFAGAQQGLGVQVAGVDQNFNAGALDNTGRSLDVAIDGGGFFRLNDGNQTVYSRDGQFHQTKDGRLANAQGALLTGYNVTNFNSPTQAATVTASGTPDTIRIPSAGLNARATTKASLQASLDAGAKAKNVADFNADDTSTYNFSRPNTVFDSQGNAHSLSLYFTKSDAAANSWQVNAQLPVAGSATELGPVDLDFDQNGNLTGAAPATGSKPAGLSDSTVNFQFDPQNGAAPLDFDFDFAGTSQTAQDFAAASPKQDGYAAGNLTGVSVADNGTVRGSYSNGQSLDLAQLALASFANEQGLTPVSGNAWQATVESGQPALGTPGSGPLGSLRGGTLEKSNVDLSKQLVNMIVAQRNYQANAQTIKTQGEVLQTAVNLAR